MRNSFVFYESFYNATKDMDAESYKKIMSVVIEYALYGVLPEDMDAVTKMAFTLIQPQIDANNKRRNNGLKGGRRPVSKEEPIQNQGEPKKEPNENQTETKEEPNANQTETEPEPNVNVNVNVNVKEKEILKKEKKHKYGAFNNVLLTDSEYQKLFDQFGEPNRTKLINFLDEAIEEKGYKYKSHYLVISKKDSWVQKMVLAKPTGWNAEKQARRGHERGTDYDAIFADAMNAPEIPFFNGTLEELAAL